MFISRAGIQKGSAVRALALLTLGGAIYASAGLTRTAAKALPLPNQASTRSAPVAVTGSSRTDLPPASPQPELSARRFTGRVGADLSKSLLAAGVPVPQGREYLWVLGRAIQLAGGLSVDDKFDLVAQRQGDGKLGQLLYVGLDRVARADVELMKWTDGKSVIWVNADGVSGETSGVIGLPVQGRVTSAFGWRFHPILGYERFHAGVDLAAGAGTPIHAAAGGRVVEAGWHGGYGQEVELAHGTGFETRYGHMSRIAARIGEVVTKGQVIGWVGSTGLATGPHVHFEVMKDGRPVNPLGVKLDDGPGHLEGEKLHQFDGELRDLLLLPAKG